MDGFFSWPNLMTFTGCSAATGLLTQLLKNTFWKLPTQWLSYLIALILLYLSTYFTGALTLSSAAVIPLNAALVAFSSNGAYSAVLRAKNGKPSGGG